MAPNSFPLCVASQDGHLQVVEALLRVPGIDVNAGNEEGWTPLFLASCNGHLQVVEALLRAVPGVDVSAGDVEEMIPLYAVPSPDDHRSELLQVVETLRELPGIDVRTWHGVALAALCCACRSGHLQVVEALLRAVPGLDVNAGDRHGQTPLHFACVSDDAEVAMVLVGAGADVNVRDRDGRSPLQVLCDRHGGADDCVRSVRATAGPALLALRLGGLPQPMAADLVMEGLDGWQRAVAELLRAGATAP